jgi:hypothetical protein
VRKTIDADTAFAGFSGGASGFGDPEFVESLRNETVVPGTGLSVFGLQSVARRQLVASGVVLVGIAVAAGLTALRPAHEDLAASQAAGHRLAVVQQPSFATPIGHNIAAVRQRSGVELP